MIDRAEIRVRAGNGGDGAASFRREKFVPRGGPDGGDGGQGGSVILLADPSVSTLGEVRYKRTYTAQSGGNGAGAKKHGRSGPDLIVRVPVGTIVQRKEADETLTLLADLDQPGDAVVAAYGGMGGKGNARFATPTNQAPRLRERGQRGGQATLVLDLKLISDVGIIGLPNAGKSTLISAVSAARPKIANYPFTTLEPVLGVVEINYETFVMADIPGLIEGAHSGVGLGHDFLRHVERTRLLVHLLDGSAADPLADFDTVNRELELFSEDLARRPQIVAINKVDIPEARERLPELQAALAARGVDALALSAATGEGTRELVQRVWGELTRLRAEQPPPVVAEPEPRVLRPQPRARVQIEQQNGRYLVHGRGVEAMAEMLDLANEEAKAEFYRRLTRLGVAAALRRAGVQKGDTVRFGAGYSSHLTVTAPRPHRRRATRDAARPRARRSPWSRRRAAAADHRRRAGFRGAARSPRGSTPAPRPCWRRPRRIPADRG
jgi:GTPase